MKYYVVLLDDTNKTMAKIAVYGTLIDAMKVGQEKTSVNAYQSTWYAIEHVNEKR